jgi:thiamine biosynthesis lipoprotein
MRTHPRRPHKRRADPATTQFELWGGSASVAVCDPTALERASTIVRGIVADFDLACSSHRRDSELSALNAAAGRPTTVSPLLFDAVAAAVEAARVTDGDVDPTVGLALVAHRLLPTGEGDGPISFEAVPGYRTVTLDRATSAITVLGGVRLDLGATAKALAADRAAAEVYADTGSGVLVNLLGDLAFAGPAPAGGWRVRVTDDHRSSVAAAGQTVGLSEGGLATSSTTTRRAADGDSHHLIDPRTGAPTAVHFQTVSVAAHSCLEANIATTAAIVRGPRALTWLTERGLPARLVGLDRTVTHLGGWPAEGEDLR